MQGSLAPAPNLASNLNRIGTDGIFVAVGLLLIGHLTQLLRFLLLKRLRDLGFRFFLDLIKQWRRRIRKAVFRLRRDVTRDCLFENSFQPRHHAFSPSEDPERPGPGRSRVLFSDFCVFSGPGRDSGDTRETPGRTRESVRPGKRPGSGPGIPPGRDPCPFSRASRMIFTNFSTCVSQFV